MKSKMILVLAATVAAGFVMAAQTDWVKVTARDGSLTIQAPPSWMVADTKDPAYIKRRDEILAKNPNLKSTLEPNGDDSQILMLMDMNDTGEDGYMDNVNIVKKPNPGITEKDYKAVGDEIMKQLPLKGKGKYEVVTMPNGKMLTYTGALKIATADKGEVVMDALGYIFVAGNSFYVVTFGTNEGNMKIMKPTYEKMVKSIKP